MIALHQIAPRLRTNEAYLARLAARQTARHGAAGASSLDTYHGISDKLRQYRSPCPTYYRPQDWEIDRLLRRHPGDRRLEFCGKWLPPGGVATLRVNESGRRARWTGVASCKSWDCPRCARHKADTIAHRLGKAIEAATAKGWFAHFVTFTMPHTKRDTLARCIRAARGGWAKVKRLLNRLPYVGGVVGALETTLGRSGWHVHCHAIVWTTEPPETGIGWHGSFSHNMAASLAESEWRGRRAELHRLAQLKPTTATQAFKLRDRIRDLENEQRALRARACRLYWATSPLWWFECQIADAWAGGVVKTGIRRPDWRQQHRTDAKVKDSGLVRYILKPAY